MSVPEGVSMRKAVLVLVLIAAAGPRPAAAAGPARGWCGTEADGAARAAWDHAESRQRRGARAQAQASSSRDVGQIAVLQDEGDLALRRNLMDLQRTALRFSPAGGGFTVARLDLPLEP